MKPEIKSNVKHPNIIIYEERWNDVGRSMGLSKEVKEDFMGNNTNWSWTHQMRAGPAGMIGTKTGREVKYVSCESEIEFLEKLQKDLIDNPHPKFARVVKIKERIKKLKGE